MSSAPVPPRSALLACWTTAWLAGEVGLPEVTARTAAYDDSHVVAGLWVDDLDLEQALGRLRAEGVTRVRLVLPVPGDPLGLPGPGAFTEAALLAGEGVVAVRADGNGWGLVPALQSHGSALDGTVTTVTWQCHPVLVDGPDPGPFLHEAEHDLRVGVMEAVQALSDLDIARWDPDVAEALEDLRRAQRRGIPDDELPGSWPARARDVLVRTRALATLVQLATSSTGGAVDAHETEARAAVLRDLARVVRRARVAAYNAHGHVA
ncbi:MAG TPA: hypothetical protein VM097_12950 [Mycobacteriales bacterium]|nr:hypothetical protein [Mycobacteriales bacterium]